MPTKSRPADPLVAVEKDLKVRADADRAKWAKVRPALDEIAARYRAAKQEFDADPANYERGPGCFAGLAVRTEEAKQLWEGLLARERAEVQAVLAKHGLWHEPGTADRDANEITLAEMCQRHDVSKSAVTKAAQRRPGDANYLRTRKVGRNRYVRADDAAAWAANYEARRDARKKSAMLNEDNLKAALRRGAK
jgi:DNA-binding transcriptional ArsR family regulator